MIKAELDKELFLACTDYDHDLDKIKKLIQAGADTNQTNEYGGSIFDFVLAYALHAVDDDEQKLSETVEKIKKLIPVMINAGWDIKKFGVSVANQFTLSTYDHFTFDLFKFILQYDLTDKHPLELLSQRQRLILVCITPPAEKNCYEFPHLPSSIC